MSDPWEGILDPDERVLWQGSPAPGIRLEWDSPFHPFFFLFFTGFSIFWMVGASAAGGFFWMFGLLFFFIGMFNLVGIHFWEAIKRQRTHYTLTDRRAFIGTNLFGRRKLDSYPITSTTQLTLEDKGGLTDIFFAEKEIRTKNGTTHKPIGFVRLKDGRDVFAKMRDAQRAIPD